MPSTYTLISSNVLTSSAASVTFSAIPSTYTDLVLRMSARTDSAPGNNASYILASINSTTTSGSFTVLSMNSASTAAFSFNATANTNWLGAANGGGSTANTFSNVELYLPSYTASQNKPMSVSSVFENNATAIGSGGPWGAFAELWSNTAAITSIAMTLSGGYNFVSGSSFYLYGIKNS